MKIFKGVMFLFLFLCFHYSFAADTSQPLAVKTEVSKNIITIGEKLKYTIDISADKNTEVDFPVFGDKIGEFIIKDSGFKENAFWGKKKITGWYTIEIFSTGKFTIPKAEIKYRKKGVEVWSNIGTEEKNIEVKSFLEGTKSGINDIHNIKGKVRVFLKSYFIWLAAFLIFIVVVIIVLIWLFLKRKPKQPVKVVRPAHEIAYEELEKLKNKNLIAQGKIKEYYIEISGIIRRYLENRFNFRAPEMTTEEFLNSVKDYWQMLTEHKVLLKDFLVCCDLVKFAKYAPAGKEIDEVFESAKRFIDQTKQEAVLQVK